MNILELIKELRFLTDAPVKDCKIALELSNGDINKAKEELKKMGLSSARTVLPEQGAISAVTKNSSIFIAVGKCETDFTAKNSLFIDAVKQAALNFSNNLNPSSQFYENVDKFKENCKLDLFTFTAESDNKIAYYLHHDNQRFGYIEYNDGGNESSAIKIATHIVATNPKYVGRDNVPVDELNSVTQSLLNTIKDSGKPEKSWDMILKGQLKKKLSETVLMEQQLYSDPKISVEQYCKDNSLIVKGFTNIMV